jgi:hypothetical protein
VTYSDTVFICMVELVWNDPKSLKNVIKICLILELISFMLLIIYATLNLMFFAEFRLLPLASVVIFLYLSFIFSKFRRKGITSVVVFCNFQLTTNWKYFQLATNWKLQNTTTNVWSTLHMTTFNRFTSFFGSKIEKICFFCTNNNFSRFVFEKTNFFR